MITPKSSYLGQPPGEFIGTAFLLATVVGSGITAERLAGRIVAIALLGNTIPTGAILYVLITVFGPVSGVHFNPAATIARSLTDTFSGIRPLDMPWFIKARLFGTVAALAVMSWLLTDNAPETERS